MSVTPFRYSTAKLSPSCNVDPVAAFRLRCEARAHLYSQGEIDLHEAVDVLEEGSRNIGISVDAAQAIIAGAFRPIREKEWIIPEKPKQETAQSTIDALLYGLRGGPACLNDAGARERLKSCDRTALRTITAELLSWPGKTKDGKDRPWLPAWPREDVAKLLLIRRVLK